MSHHPEFFHELVEPLQTLHVRCARKIAIDSNVSDVITMARRMAVSAYHYAEGRLGPRAAWLVDPALKLLNDQLADVADTWKHGVCRDPRRTTQVTSAVAFEFDERCWFRFIGTQVHATNGRFGEFDLVDSITEFVSKIAPLFDIEFKVIRAFNEDNPFARQIELEPGPETYYANSQSLRFYRRHEDKLVIADPPEGFEFVLNWPA